MDLDPDHLLRGPFLAGLSGSIVALRWVPGSTLAERLFNGAAGTAVAGFGAPALSAWLHITSADITSALAFAVGLFGLSLAAAVVQAIRDLKLAEIITGWISRRG